jgi:hypothetical protein
LWVLRVEWREWFRVGEVEHTPGAKAPFAGFAEEAKAEALAYLEDSGKGHDKYNSNDKSKCGGSSLRSE